MTLTREEFLAIRERRSQDDLNTLIAHVDEQFGIAPPAPVVPAVVPASEPQTVVTVAPTAEVAPKSETAKKPSRTSK